MIDQLEITNNDSIVSLDYLLSSYELNDVKIWFTNIWLKCEYSMHECMNIIYMSEVRHHYWIFSNIYISLSEFLLLFVS